MILLMYESFALPRGFPIAQHCKPKGDIPFQLLKYNFCTICFSQEGDSVVVDHVNFAASSEGDHSLIVAENFIESTVLFGPFAVKVRWIYWAGTSLLYLLRKYRKA